MWSRPGPVRRRSFEELLGKLRIERTTAPPGEARPATDSSAARAIPREARLCLRGRMRASVMRRQDLEVFDLPAAVGPLVFDTQIGELDVVVENGQVVGVRPLVDFL